MARVKLEINKVDLLNAIQLVEKTQTFTTRNDLANAVAATSWAKSFQPKPVTASVVLLRIAEFGLDSEIKTPKGKRGRAAGFKLTSAHKAAMRTGRGKAKSASGESIALMRKQFPASRQGLIDRIAKGSKLARIKAMCLSCTNFETDEIRHCTVVSCPLYDIRPYQGNK